MLENSLFAVLALIMLSGAAAMVYLRQTLYGAFGFLCAMLAMAGLFALLENGFLFLAQIMVAVGAVVVLSLMVIVSVNAKDENLPHEPYKLRWILFSAVLTLPFGLLLYRALVHLHRGFAESAEGFGTLHAVGASLFQQWVLPFEIVSVLLLAAMLGAIVIARKEQP
ncbi:NADH-quinone oxidoreductase subunit J family protein [Thiomicrolovo sp. ZZH C-3]